uniref:Uncharacterized protein n=1 Tax=Romanomermis culicivorax TaxID=13658 RepID=A0A915I8X6_ROMCU
MSDGGGGKRFIFGGGAITTVLIKLWGGNGILGGGRCGLKPEASVGGGNRITENDFLFIVSSLKDASIINFIRSFCQYYAHHFVLGRSAAWRIKRRGNCPPGDETAPPDRSSRRRSAPMYRRLSRVEEAAVKRNLQRAAFDCRQAAGAERRRSPETLQQEEQNTISSTLPFLIH